MAGADAHALLLMYDGVLLTDSRDEVPPEGHVEDGCGCHAVYGHVGKQRLHEGAGHDGACGRGKREGEGGDREGRSGGQVPG